MQIFWQMHSEKENEGIQQCLGYIGAEWGSSKERCWQWCLEHRGEEFWPLYGGFVACTKQTMCPILFQKIWKTSCFSTRNHPDNWLPWINPIRTRDRAGLLKPSSKRILSIFEEYNLNDAEKWGFWMSENLAGAWTKLDGRKGLALFAIWWLRILEEIWGAWQRQN